MFSVELVGQIRFIHSIHGQYLILFHRTVIQLSFTGLEVRLLGMNTPNVGRLQIKYNGKWGAICAVLDFTYQAAEVICRQLHQGPPLMDSFISDKCQQSIQGTMSVWLTEIQCQGFEVSLNQCSLKFLGGLEDKGCLACKLCTVCLICQPRQENFTGNVNRYLVSQVLQ